MNTASRLVGTAADLPEGSVVVSEKVFRHLPENSHVEFLPEVRLKGKTEVLAVFRIIEFR